MSEARQLSAGQAGAAAQSYILTFALPPSPEGTPPR